MPHDLNYYMKVWNLSDARLLADTPTSTIFAVTRNNETVVLKMFTPTGEKDEKNGAIALKCFAGEGAVKLFEYDASAQLLEFVEGMNLVSLAKNGEDQKATSIIADVLNKIHSSYSGPPPPELTPLKKRFASLFKKAEEEKSNGLDSIFARAAGVAKLLLKDQKQIRVLHGDIHHENIRHSEKRGWLAIDPKGVVGERTYDAVNALCNPWDMTSLVESEQRLLTAAMLLADKLKLDRSRLLRFALAHACLSASWSLEDGDDPTHAINMAKIIEPHIAYAFTPGEENS